VKSKHEGSIESERMPQGEAAEASRVRVRPGGRSARIQQAVYEAAIDLLVEEGEAGLRLPAVAERAGVSKKTVYRWWTSPSELLREALGDLEDRGIELPDTGGWESDVHAFVRSFAAYLAEPRSTAVLRYVVLARASDPRFGAWINAFWAERNAAFDVLVQRAVARGELPKETGPLPFVVLVAGPIVLHTVLVGRELSPEEIDHLAAIVARGMLGK
jgi:AcrR family transcriptional regulator